MVLYGEDAPTLYAGLQKVGYYFPGQPGGCSTLV